MKYILLGLVALIIGLSLICLGFIAIACFLLGLMWLIMYLLSVSPGTASLITVGILMFGPIAIASLYTMGLDIENWWNSGDRSIDNLLDNIDQPYNSGEGDEDWPG